jgi:phage terminase large subunit GpA-like protein
MPTNSGADVAVKGWVSVSISSRGQRQAQQTYPANVPDNTGRSTRRAQATGDVPLYLLQTDALKDRVNNALWRDSPGPGYVHFPPGWAAGSMTN